MPPGIYGETRARRGTASGVSLRQHGLDLRGKQGRKLREGCDDEAKNDHNGADGNNGLARVIEVSIGGAQRGVRGLVLWGSDDGLGVAFFALCALVVGLVQHGKFGDALLDRVGQMIVPVLGDAVGGKPIVQVLEGDLLYSNVRAGGLRPKRCLVEGDRVASYESGFGDAVGFFGGE